MDPNYLPPPDTKNGILDGFFGEHQTTPNPNGLIVTGAWRPAPPGFHNFLHINGAMSMVSTVISVLLILTRSSDTMKVYRWYLLSITLSCGILDWYCGQMYVADLMYPKTGICLNQRSAADGRGEVWQLVAHIVAGFLIFLMNFTMLMAFAYRLAAIIGTLRILHSWRAVLIVLATFVLFLTPIYLCFAYAVQQGHDEIYRDMEENYRNMFLFASTRQCSFVSIRLTPKAVITLFSIALLSLLGCIIGSLSLIVTIFYKLKKYNKIMTRTTYKMQRHLFITLIIQFILPTVFIAFPMIFLILLVLFDSFEGQASSYIGFILMNSLSCHSNLNALAMILMVRPYRETVFFPFIFFADKVFHKKLRENEMPTISMNAFKETKNTDKLFVSRADPHPSEA